MRGGNDSYAHACPQDMSGKLKKKLLLKIGVIHLNEGLGVAIRGKTNT